MLSQIVINDLSVSYGGKEALTGVSTHFEKGRLYALIGHNGAGKTTLIKEILKANLKQTKIRYITENGDKSDKKLKYKMAFSPEKPVLFEDLTVLEYITFVLKMYEAYDDNHLEKVDALLKSFRLEKEKNKFIFALSNGMKKKVGHIAALALNADFIFLDEPFAALDPISIYELKNYLLAHRNESAFVLSTHQLDIIDNLAIDPDQLHIRLLNQGQLLFNGTKTELLAPEPFNTIEEAYLFYHEPGAV